MNDLVFLIKNSTLSLYENANNFIIYVEINDIRKCMLLSDIKVVENWFLEKYLVLNPEKCHFFVFGRNVSDLELLNIDDLNLKILCVIIDRNLKFKCHIKFTYKEKDQELNAL